MARYVKELVLNKPESFVNFIMEDYIKKNSFVQSTWKDNEAVYRAGDRMMEGFKFLKWSYNNGVLYLEAWLKGSFVKEMGLTGFVATVQKTPYRKSLEELYEVLQQELPEGGMQDLSGAQTIPVRTVDNSGAATMSLVFGVLSIFVGLLIPLAGIILACIGFSRARMGSGSSNAGMAKAGKILSVIGAIICIAIWVLNFIFSFTIFF